MSITPTHTTCGSLGKHKKIRAVTTLTYYIIFYQRSVTHSLAYCPDCDEQSHFKYFTHTDYSFQKFLLLFALINFQQAYFNFILSVLLQERIDCIFNPAFFCQTSINLLCVHKSLCNQIYKWMDKTARECRAGVQCEVYSIGQSYEGRPLKVFKVLSVY